ncbi:MAG: hypothetical protein IKO06_02800 [Alphaproteobacteria bacterium]|nr:hypothetical protein [Alphaproteobacteria bacterium]
MRNLKIKNNNSLYRKGRESQSGRSMIEMLGVLAIIGVLSVGGIAGYSKAMMKYKINKTIEQITLIAGNVHTFFAPQGNYDGLSYRTTIGNAIIQKAKLVPDEMLEYYTSGEDAGKINKIIYPFGEVQGFGYVGDSNKKEWGFILEDLPIEACIEIATHDWREAKITEISVSSDNSGGINIPAEIDEAVTRCDSSYGTVDLYLTFK